MQRTIKRFAYAWEKTDRVGFLGVLMEKKETKQRMQQKLRTFAAYQSIIFLRLDLVIVSGMADGGEWDTHSGSAVGVETLTNRDSRFKEQGFKRGYF